MSKLEYEMTLDNSQFVGGLRAGQTALTSTTGQIGATGKAAGVATGLVNKLAGGFLLLKAAQAGLAMAKEGFFKAGALETEKVRLEVLLGSMEKADQLMADVMKKAGETPLQTEELQQAARMLIAFGSSSDTVVDELTRIGDISEGVGGGIGELAEIYGKARVQGTLFAEDINQLLNKGIPVISEFAKQLGVSESEIKKMASEGKITFANLEQAFIDLTSQGGKFNGMMEKIAKTSEGQMSTLKDNFNALILLPVGNWVNSWLDPMVKGLNEAADAAKRLDNVVSGIDRRGRGSVESGEKELAGLSTEKAALDFAKKAKEEAGQLDAQLSDLFEEAGVGDKAVDTEFLEKTLKVEEKIARLKDLAAQAEMIAKDHAALAQRAAEQAADKERQKQLEHEKAMAKAAELRAEVQGKADADAKDRADKDVFQKSLDKGDKGPIEAQLAASKAELADLLSLMQTSTDIELLKDLPGRIKDARNEAQRLQAGLEQIDESSAEKRKKSAADAAKAAAEALAESRGSLLEGAKSALVLPEVTEFRKRGLGFEGDVPRQDLVKRQVDLLTKIEAELKKLNNKPVTTAETGWSNG
jgi:tape measure domain-containing protein